MVCSLRHNAATAPVSGWLRASALWNRLGDQTNGGLVLQEMPGQLLLTLHNPTHRPEDFGAIVVGVLPGKGFDVHLLLGEELAQLDTLHPGFGLLEDPLPHV